MGTPFTDPMVPLEDGLISTLVDRYGLYRAEPEWQRRWSQVPDADPPELIMPVYSPHKTRLGCVRRSVTAKGKKKVKTYREMAGHPMMDFWLWPDHSDELIVIVEDQISAARVYGLGYNSVALLGTHLPRAGAGLIANTGCPVVFALDPDAFKQAVGYLTSHADVLDGAKAVLLEHDPKDYKDDTHLRDILGGLSTWNNS
jgi:hypothetical protein